MSRMPVHSWWSEDHRWFCVKIGVGEKSFTLSLNPDEARIFIADLHTLIKAYEVVS